MPPTRPPDDPAAPNPPSTTSADRALDLLELFSTHDRVRIADASRELGISDSTAHRLMQVLRHHDYVRQDPASRAYMPGPKLMRIGLTVAASSSDLRRLAHPWLQWLVTQVQETVHLVQLQGDVAVFLDSVETTRPLRIGARIGEQIPAYATAAGKVLLAALAPEDLRRILPADALPAITDNSQTSVEKLKAELLKVRRQGYATNFHESEPDLHAVAVPVLDRHGLTRASLAISAPVSRLRASDVPTLAQQATKAATQITGALSR